MRGGEKGVLNSKNNPAHDCTSPIQLPRIAYSETSELKGSKRT